MSVAHTAHLGEELEGEDPGLAEVAHDADGHGEEAGGVVGQPHAALLRLGAQLEAQQALVLVRQRLLEDGLVQLRVEGGVNPGDVGLAQLDHLGHGREGGGED